MNLPDLDGMDRAADEGVIFNGAIIKQLTAIIRQQQRDIAELKEPTLFDRDYEHG